MSRRWIGLVVGAVAGTGILIAGVAGTAVGLIAIILAVWPPHGRRRSEGCFSAWAVRGSHCSGAPR